jgi:ATP-dependent DNA ligase
MASRSRTAAVTPPSSRCSPRSPRRFRPRADYLFEPKWDGFRAIVFRGKDDVFIQSRDLRPFDRYFPDLHALFLERLPPAAWSTARS